MEPVESKKQSPWALIVPLVVGFAIAVKFNIGLGILAWIILAFLEHKIRNK
jgi:hypothetical protein